MPYKNKRRVKAEAEASTNEALLARIAELEKERDVLNNKVNEWASWSKGQADRNFEKIVDGIAYLAGHIIDNGELIPEEEVQKMVNICIGEIAKPKALGEQK